MKIVKVLNHNSIVAKDNENREMILIGKGIAYGPVSYTHLLKCNGMTNIDISLMVFLDVLIINVLCFISITILTLWIRCV